MVHPSVCSFLSQVEALGDAAAVAEENAALRRMLADLDAELATLAAESERLRDENLELSSAVAAQSVDAAELQEMADTLAVSRVHLSGLHAFSQRSPLQRGQGSQPILG